MRTLQVISHGSPRCHRPQTITAHWAVLVLSRRHHHPTSDEPDLHCLDHQWIIRQCQERLVRHPAAGIEVRIRVARIDPILSPAVGFSEIMKVLAHLHH